MSSKRSPINIILILVLMTVVLFTTTVMAQSSYDLIIHYVEGQPLTDQVGYSVNIYLSALDANGNPLLGVNLEDFIINEDSRQVEIESVSYSDNLPINLLLLIDTSGSMQGSAISDARNAASSFISRLIESDQIAVFTFNEEMTTLTDFTSDRQGIAQKVKQINAVNLASTCLYDAAYEAVTKAATVTNGRRAIVLLTDGQDYKNQGPCSVHTIDDLVELSSAGSMRVPIHIIGLGSEVDQSGLKRIAEMSGGIFTYAPSSSALAEIFDRLSSQLRSEIIINYNSTAAPGAHTVVVQLKHDNLSAQDSRSFLLPALPTQVIILSPAEGQEVSGITKIVAAVTGQGQVVQSVKFLRGDEEIGSDATIPYEIEWDSARGENGAQNLKVIAYGSEGQELASSSLTVEVAGSSGTAGMDTSFLSNPVVIGGLIALLVGGGLLIFFFNKSKKQVVDKSSDGFELKEGTEKKDSDHTIDFQLTPQELSEDAIATLKILASDDAGMIMQELNITSYPCLIGRSAECDVVIPKEDSPVSRKHVRLELRDGLPTLLEEITVDESGNPKSPTYGTFVNEQKVMAGGVCLKNGDEIRLGSRFRMRFNMKKKSTQGSEERTLDNIDLADLADKTKEVPRE